MNFQHEDVVCRRFPYTFEILASTQYFNLPIGSITNWTKFQKDFLDKFEEESMTRELMAELLCWVCVIFFEKLIPCTIH
jgi:hypothetical protein